MTTSEQSDRHPIEGRTSLGGCRVYWGSHGCDRPSGHDGPHLCLSCWTEDEDGWIGAPPYYGPETCFYGEDAEALGLPLVKDRRS